MAAGQEIKLSTKIDEAILGGLVVQIGDQTIDMSASSRLNAVKKSLE